MTLLSRHAYTVVMAFGHPGTVKLRGAATVLSPLDAVRAAADPAGVCSSVVATFLVPLSPHTAGVGALPGTREWCLEPALQYRLAVEVPGEQRS